MYQHASSPAVGELSQLASGESLHTDGNISMNRIIVTPIREVIILRGVNPFEEHAHDRRNRHCRCLIRPRAALAGAVLVGAANRVLDSAELLGARAAG